jgi:hypothetical protein
MNLLKLTSRFCFVFLTLFSFQTTFASSEDNKRVLGHLSNIEMNLISINEAIISRKDLSEGVNHLAQGASSYQLKDSSNLYISKDEIGLSLRAIKQTLPKITFFIKAADQTHFLFDATQFKEFLDSCKKKNRISFGKTEYYLEKIGKLVGMMLGQCQGWLAELDNELSKHHRPRRGSLPAPRSFRRSSIHRRSLQENRRSFGERMHPVSHERLAQMVMPPTQNPHDNLSSQRSFFPDCMDRVFPRGYMDDQFLQNCGIRGQDVDLSAGAQAPSGLYPPLPTAPPAFEDRMAADGQVQVPTQPKVMQAKHRIEEMEQLRKRLKSLERATMECGGLRGDLDSIRAQELARMHSIRNRGNGSDC